jgi:HSP20 family protein
MMSTRWQPLVWNQLERFQSEVNHLLDRVGLGQGQWPSMSSSFPPVNVWEEDEALHVEAELPGMKLDQLEIYVCEGTQLTLQGERQLCKAENGVWHRQERGVGKFNRTIALPVAVDPDKVEARFENGVLHVTLPKSEAAKPRRITVKGE